MLRFGPETGPVVVVAMPLFEEANRMRAFAVTLCRLLADRGVASVLPDLPGQGESLVPTANLTLEGLRAGLNAAVEVLFEEARHVYTVALRSGALLDVQAHSLGRWYLSPVSIADLSREQVRVLEATGRRDEARQLRNVFQSEETAFPVEVGGNLLGAALLQELATDRELKVLHRHGVIRHTVRLTTDPAPADRHLPGTPLWRRAEPDNDPALAALLADDIVEWIARCEG